jgi:UDP:flavonoid glycosyltransferase YjiC (YdhE family)
LLDHLQPGDVLIGTRNLFLLSLVARARQCHWLDVGLNSGSMVDYDRLPLARDSTHPWKQGVENLEWELRQRLLAGASRDSDPPPLLRLHAVPDAFAPLELPQLEAVRTGFWCWQDPRWQRWAPPQELVTLLASGLPPLGLVFSSQPLVDPATVIKRHLEVAQRLGRALVVVKGWAFSTAAQSRDPQLAAALRHHDLLAVEPLPLAWLLPHLSAVFVHGGIGTLAEALRAGCQVVIEPFGNDQFLNARLALQHGLALAVHPHRFNPQQVSQALARQLALRPHRLHPSAYAGLPRAAELVCARMGSMGLTE